MKDNYTVERMSKQDIQTAISWAAKEGWNPGLNDAECFYCADPNGFFVGKLDNKIIAVGSAVVYDDNFAFCGFYIVDEPYRGHGFGMRLTTERLKYVNKRNAGIDGVLNMVAKYSNISYKFAHNNARYTTVWQKKFLEENHRCAPLATIDFAKIKEYDRYHFPASRDIFLHCWIDQPGALALGYVENDNLVGYGVIRPCVQGFKIGPIFANTPKIADELFTRLADHGANKDIYLDIPENNPNAIELVNKYRMKKVFATARMYLKETPDIRSLNIYGITSFELG